MESRLQVIAGTAGGRRLEVPAAGGAKPPLALVRGAIFNSLAPRLGGARVLDLYAGSGAMGIEALSRGAAAAVFVERNPACAAAIRRNLEHCRLDDIGAVRVATVEEAVEEQDGAYDVILADPPFQTGRTWSEDPSSHRIAERVAALLAGNGVLVFRQDKRDPTPREWPGLAIRRERTYGRSRVLFCEHESEAT
jgi:16S rRNA (guanine966-N2)-methyltransferase